jgi:hypothetical protein
MRKQVTYTVAAVGRGHGKVALLSEMPAGPLTVKDFNSMTR